MEVDVQQARTLPDSIVPAVGRTDRLQSHVSKHIVPYLLILPSVLFLIAIEFYPLAVGIYEAFLYHNRVQPWATQFIGLQNFTTALGTHDVQLALKTSFIMVFGIVALGYGLGLLAAVLLNQKLRGKGIYRALILVPWIIPPVVSYISWQWMLNDQSGAINLALMRLGLTNPIDPIIWLADPNLAMVSIVSVGAWSRFPFMMITMLAALSAISDDLHEAASLDGADRWRRFRDITLPLILPVSVIATLLQAIWTFNDFALPFVLTGGGPANATTTLVLLAYKEAFRQFNIGYGTSLAVISMLLMLALGTIYLRLQSRQETYV